MGIQKPIKKLLIKIFYERRCSSLKYPKVFILILKKF